MQASYVTIVIYNHHIFIVQATQVGSGPTHKHYTRLERPTRGKQSSFSGPFVSYKENKLFQAQPQGPVL
jgi:hypothetical protein